MPTLFLGTDPDKRREPRRLSLERHAMTIAGSRMGKGACQIIPTLKEWDSGAIVIDPKGEAAITTIEDRITLGQEIAVLDPMRLLPSKFDAHRRTFDPLSLVRTGGAGFRDLMAIADGLVLASGQERDPHWNESAQAVIAGCLAYLVESDEEERPHLGQLPDMVTMLRTPLKQKPDTDGEKGQQEKNPLIEAMFDCEGFGGLAAGTAALLAAGTNETNSILSSAGRHLRFLGDADIRAALRPSPDTDPALDLSKLRTGKLTLYVVMDPGSLVLHSRFMRLFVRLALSVMMDTKFEDGRSENAPCLFVLDEFYSLGKINDLQKAAGLMPGYGVHLWPILQDWGQLVDLYDVHGAQTFLANADAVSVFGVSDQTTLQEVSSWFGEVSVDELQREALSLAGEIEGSEAWRKLLGSMGGDQNPVVLNQQLLTQSTLLQARIGRPARAPSDIQAHVTKPFDDPGHPVAKRMFVFLRTREILDLVPTPYFADPKKRGWFR